MKCPECQSKNSVKWGSHEDRQRYRCKDCEKTYSINKQVVASVLELYYSGNSVREVQRRIKNLHGKKIHYSTVWQWVQHFGPAVKAELDIYPAEIGGELHADETVIKCNGETAYYWEVLDADTRFILSTHLSQSRRSEDAITLFQAADDKFEGNPDKVVTDGLQAYKEGFNKTWWTRYKDERPEFVHEAGLRGNTDHNDDNNLIERFHGNLKDRYRVMRGLGSIKTAKSILDGWVTHYNFVRPHMGLDGKTPAEVAGIGFEIETGWNDLIANTIG